MRQSDDASRDGEKTQAAPQAKKAGAAVKAALAANIGVALAKFAAAAFTGSSSMFSESVHSVADCANEIVLMIGDRTSDHKSDGDHPFGLHRIKYLASFIVATLLFFVGGVFAVSQAVGKLTGLLDGSLPREAESVELIAALVVVAVSACLEGYGLHTSVHEARERMARVRVESDSLVKFWRRTKSAELASVMMEDTLALIGLAFAGLGIGLSIVTGDELYDAIGGLMVGLVLVCGSAALAFKSGSLLIGEDIDPRTREMLVEAVEGTQGVNRLINMQAIHMDEDAVLLCLKVETDKFDRDYDVQTVDKIETNIRTALPWYEWEIYVEPDIWRARH
ncbi:cation diffusion facilitator family transporter [Bifidobacterium platyrrhinorum]|uniref:Cation diffusion facilitator family transporter n=1 Tax=Bifidobacterium platyrrhinorum TaxID=2661628 RepID=A0A6L9ST78_9BIFI|nr:cation diffusion facilitator family transporter [Bifidobacterium platyrrhinorum]NEG55787.1 cation diffusion facilitator family transporter [Bifidobacterium platyrrhinorum]